MSKSCQDYFALVTIVLNSTFKVTNLFILYIHISWIFRETVSKFRKDQKVCSQGINLLMQLIRHLDDQANPGSSLQESRDIAAHILNAFW